MGRWRFQACFSLVLSLESCDRAIKPLSWLSTGIWTRTGSLRPPWPTALVWYNHCTPSPLFSSHIKLSVAGQGAEWSFSWHSANNIYWTKTAYTRCNHRESGSGNNLKWAMENWKKWVNYALKWGLKPLFLSLFCSFCMLQQREMNGPCYAKRY